jgi:tetratricopeptide (TPR) repeat protein
MIDEYLAIYSESPEVPFLQNIKKETLYELAVEAQENRNYFTALQLYNQILVEFPDTHRRDTIIFSMDDIYYDQIMAIYNDGRFGEVVRAVENRIIENPPVFDRWLTLWEDAMFYNIAVNVGVLSPRATRIRSRVYLSELPRGRYVDDVKTMLVEAFNTPYTEAYKSGNYAEVISLYEENRGWLASWPDQLLNANAKVIAASSLLQMGMKAKAAELFRTIPPIIAPEYAILGYSLCERNITYDINRLSPEDFMRAMEHAQACGDPQYQLALMNRYTKDRKFALKAQFDLSKNISDDNLREVILRDIHSQLVSNPAGTQFDGYEEVFFDVGMLAYRKNDFRGAIIPLNRYVSLIQANTNKKSEALFYLAKSLAAVNEWDNAAQYFQQIVDTMPDSIFKSMARGELEDNRWRQNMIR